MAAAAAQISSSPHRYYSARETSALLSAVKTASSARFPRKLDLGTAFASGSPNLIEKPIYRRICVYRYKSVPIRCEQRSKQSNAAAGVWLGRLAMVGFASAIAVEIATARGLLENLGVGTPLPTVALAVTVLVGVLAAVLIFQSASEI